jgi:hypothetical protein
MEFEIILTETAIRACDNLAQTDPGKLRKVYKTLGLLQTNPKHPSIQTHEYSSLEGPNGEKVFEAYVENRTPAAFRVFWYYGPGRKKITVFAVTPHP